MEGKTEIHKGLITPRKLEFGANKAFEVELRRRVDAFFKETGRRKRDCWQMYVKSIIILCCFVILYVLLVFKATMLWQAVPLAILLGLTTAAIGFNIQHDGGHKSYSGYPWVNKVASMTLDLIGGSSYVWHWKHGLIHHLYVNITGYDTDINLGFLGRLSPHQKRYPFYRWQHFYLWPFYGLLAIKWHLFDDFWNVSIGRIGRHPLPRPKGWDLSLFVGGKALFLTYVFVIPLLFHPLSHVIPFYIGIELMLGVLLSAVFQVPHCREGADFPLPRQDTGKMENPWAVHQAQVTADFARRERVATWLLGGLNYHIEHHLFPVICHVNYPSMSKIVEETCRDFGVRYQTFSTFRAGVASHYRWLREMGLPEENAPVG